MTLEELRKLAEAATPGPWEKGSAIEPTPLSELNGRTGTIADWGQITICGGHGLAILNTTGGYESRESDHKNVAFIATFNPSTVLALLERIAKAEEALEEFAHDPHESDCRLQQGRPLCKCYCITAKEALTALREPLK